MSWFTKVFGGKKDSTSSPTTDDNPGVEPGATEQQLPASDADEVLPEDNRSLLLQLISKSGLTMGVDLAKVTLPTFILEPRSLLQKLSDTVVHPEFFSTIADGATPEQRMALVCRWYMSAYHVRPKGTKKPYNPVLGETFQARYTTTATTTSSAAVPPPPSASSSSSSSATGARGEHSGANGNVSVHWVSQQVSHHPPVSAFFARSLDGRTVMQGTFAPKSKFLGNSAASMGGGAFRLYLPEHREVYYLTWPNVYVRGVLFGTLLMEIGGDVTITCPASGVQASLTFETKGYFSGKHHAVKGKIQRIAAPASAGSPALSPRAASHPAPVPLATVDGLWISKVDISTLPAGLAAGMTNVCFDKLALHQTIAQLTILEPFDAELNNAMPEVCRMYSSQHVWAGLTTALERNDQTLATEAKNEVEERQRTLRTRRKDESIDFVPSLFRQTDPNNVVGWEYVGADNVAIPE